MTTFNPNNPSVYAIIKSTFESLQENEVDGTRDFKLIHNRRQPANLKDILKSAEFSTKLHEVSKCIIYSKHKQKIQSELEYRIEIDIETL